MPNKSIKLKAENKKLAELKNRMFAEMKNRMKKLKHLSALRMSENVNPEWC